MADEFCIPAKAEDLINEDEELPFKIRRLNNFEDAAPAEVEEYAEGTHSYDSLYSGDDEEICAKRDNGASDRFTPLPLVAGALYDICNQDALCVVEQDLFDKLYSIIRGFKHVSSISRKRLVDGLCSNLSVLGLSIGALVSVQEPDDPAEHEASAASHRSALKAYAFFLSWLTALAEEEAQTAVPDPSAAAGRGKGRKKATGAQAVLQWDWDSQRDKVGRSLAVVTDIDLWKLYRPKPIEESLLQTCSKTAGSSCSLLPRQASMTDFCAAYSTAKAQLLLESAQAMKSKAARDGAFATLAACALRYGQLEAVAGASIAALTRNEHLAGVLAELAEFCEAKYHDERLGAEMLQEVAAVSPHEYERQQKDDLASSGGVRNVAKFVESLAERCPKLVAGRISLLMAHLGGKAYSLRSAIVTAIGVLAQKAFENVPGEDADAQGRLS
ncbi:g3074 [Coccomyxa viridis]|uniref:G3074 protein n=1 Tax=Coccomyxa viridis TaxID=1274662 RepID=A0ABP1FLX7_9CHLO